MSELSVRETAARALLIAEQEADEYRAAAARYWDRGDLPDTVIPRPLYRHWADAVLAAVADHDGLAPLLRAHTYHDWAQDCRCRIAGDDAMDGDDWAAHLADVVRAWLRGGEQTGHPRVDPDTDLLAELTRCTTTPAERRARLQNAITIAKAGGVDDRTLEALLHLANVKAMTSTAARALRDVGISIEPWGPQ